MMEMKTYVLDACAIVALFNEIGADVDVADRDGKVKFLWIR